MVLDRIMRIVVSHTILVDVDKLINDCELAENASIDDDPTDEETAWVVAGFFDPDLCIPRWARKGVTVVPTKKED
jgi:hypothetical protein